MDKKRYRDRFRRMVAQGVDAGLSHREALRRVVRRCPQLQTAVVREANPDAEKRKALRARRPQATKRERFRRLVQRRVEDGMTPSAAIREVVRDFPNLREAMLREANPA